MLVRTAVISGGVASTGWRLLSEAAPVEASFGGASPYGLALATAADGIERLIVGTLAPKGLTVRSLMSLWAGDFDANDSDPAAVEAGVQRYRAVVKKFFGEVTVLVPESGVNEALARRVDLGERGLRPIDTAPASLLVWTLASVTGKRPSDPAAQAAARAAMQ